MLDPRGLDHTRRRLICPHDRPTVRRARNDSADGVLAQRDARATADAAPAPLRIARGISAFAIFAIFLALHRTDGASTCWKKQVKIDDGPERLVPPQGGTNGSNPTCSSAESANQQYRIVGILLEVLSSNGNPRLAPPDCFDCLGRTPPFQVIAAARGCVAGASR